MGQPTPEEIYERYTRRAEIAGWLIVVGLGVELVSLIAAGRPLSETIPQAIADVLIAGGVAFELLFSRKARVAGDRIQAEAKSEAARANARAAEADARTKEAELKIQEIVKISGPRHINRELFLKELEGKPKSRVQVWYVSNTSGGFWFAHEIFTAIIEAGWEITEPCRPVPEVKPDPTDPMTTFVSAATFFGGQPNGVTVVGPQREPGPSESNPSQTALMRAIGTGFGGVIYGSPHTSIPAGSLRVIVAAKPDLVPMLNVQSTTAKRETSI